MAFLSEKAIQQIEAATEPKMRKTHIAKRIGCSDSRLSLMISGRLQVRPEEMLILADLFDMDPEEVIEVREPVA
jgi:plasmid maintenance system antidote protein VapI